MAELFAAAWALLPIVLLVLVLVGVFGIWKQTERTAKAAEQQSAFSAQLNEMIHNRFRDDKAGRRG